MFDREEIKRGIAETEVEEHRTVVTANLDNSENELTTVRRESAFLRRTRSRSHSPRRTWSSYPRYDDSKHEDKGSYRSDREKGHSTERKDSDRSYRHHRERYRDHSRHRKKTYRYRDSPRERRDRDSPRERRDRDSPRERRYRDSPRERRDRDGPREQMVLPAHYIEENPVSIYYGVENFQPTPLMVGPWVPIRGYLGENINPPMMRPPPLSRGVPPYMYGFRPRLNRSNVGIPEFRLKMHGSDSRRIEGVEHVLRRDATAST